MSSEGDSNVQNSSQVSYQYVTQKVSDSEVSHESGSKVGRIDFYNKNAATYDDDMQVHKYKGAAVAATEVHEWLKGDASKSILDVGGGTGLIIAELRKYGPYNNADGLDPAEALLQVAVENGYYKNIFPKYFYYGCGMESNSYDVVCTSGTLVPGHLKAESLKEMCNIVKPGGAVIIVMRAAHMETDEDLAKVRPTIEELVKEKKWEVVKDYLVEEYFYGTQGQVFVFKKL